MGRRVGESTTTTEFALEGVSVEQWEKGVPGFRLPSLFPLLSPLRLLSGSSQREGERASVPTVGSGPPRARAPPPDPPRADRAAAAPFLSPPRRPRLLADRLSSRQRWPRPRDLTAPPGGWGGGALWELLAAAAALGVLR